MVRSEVGVVIRKVHPFGYIFLKGAYLLVIEMGKTRLFEICISYLIQYKRLK